MILTIEKYGPAVRIKGTCVDAPTSKTTVGGNWIEAEELFIHLGTELEKHYGRKYIHPQPGVESI